MRETAEGICELLKTMREDASSVDAFGPSVLIAGPTDAGKSTLSRQILWNAICERNKSIVFADLDIGQGEISLPGTVSASVVHPSSLIVNELTDLEEYGATHNYPLKFTNELTYFVGHTNMGEKQGVFKWYVNQLANKIRARQEAEADLRTSGVVLNTCGWIEGAGYQLLLHCIRSFLPTIVIVVGDEKLYDQLLHEGLSRVVWIPRSPFAKRRSAAYRREARMARIRDYFTKRIEPTMPFFHVDVSFKDITIYRVMQSNRGQVAAKKEAIDVSMTHQIVGACIKPATLQLVSTSNVQAFLFIRSVDVKAKIITFVCPSAGDLPFKHFILGQIEWTEG